MRDASEQLDDHGSWLLFTVYKVPKMLNSLHDGKSPSPAVCIFFTSQCLLYKHVDILLFLYFLLVSPPFSSCHIISMDYNLRRIFNLNDPHMLLCISTCLCNIFCKCCCTCTLKCPPWGARRPLLSSLFLFFFLFFFLNDTV